MPKRENESAEEYKARKKAKKEKKKLNKSKNDKGSKTNEVKDIVPSLTKMVEFSAFEDAPFAESTQKALKDAGFTKPSPVQARVWPPAVNGKDVIAVAKTGSGKTLGFLLPIFHRIHNNDIPGGVKNNNNSVDNKRDIPSPLGLVLSPTRELAIQIHKESSRFGASLNIQSGCLYGGTSVSLQVKELQTTNPKVVICTPGRLCDLLERKTAISLENCRFCILDECDRILDLGFEEQLNQIMEILPQERQTLFFTATWPKSARNIASTFLRKDETEEIFVGNDGSGELAANKAVTQTFVQAQDDEKDKKLYDILCKVGNEATVMVFTNTKRRADYVNNIFWQEGFATCAVHGDKPQKERDASLQMFTKRERNIMIATDVAARGLDIKGVTHVINFDMARDVETYVHRIGRTGRAGAAGEAITFWNPDYDKACSPALVTIAKKAGQAVPEFLQKYDSIKTSKQWKVSDAEKASTELLKAS